MVVVVIRERTFIVGVCVSSVSHHTSEWGAAARLGSNVLTSNRRRHAIPSPIAALSEFRVLSRLVFTDPLRRRAREPEVAEQRGEARARTTVT